MLPRYYLNDYFTLIDSPFLKEKEFMKTDIREYQNKYIIEIDLPGLKKEDITINYENGYLTIKATKNTELKTEVYVRRERFYGEVKRSFYIGEKKETDIKASYENGILTITFPKEEYPKKNIQNITIK
ncbi:MAG: Hsp20/alpha crystallin family protein [Bacilli bacterium]